MNIAIITIYDAQNCGSFLQAYALQTVLHRYGHQVTFLDCRKWTLMKIAKKWISFRHCVFKIKRGLAYESDIKLLHIKKNKNQPYDIAIIGSDEVWNINGYFEHVPEFFGKNLNASKIIAYAPSMGFTREEDFKQSGEAANLVSFHDIFPRDIITQKVCEDLTGKQLVLVCDPTLLMIDEWKKHVRKANVPNKPYILYYSYLDNTPMKEYMRRYAEEKQFKLVIANFNYIWGEIVLPSPLQFLDFVQNAECVFTSTFHGTIFATIFQKKLVVRPSGQKVVDYLNRIGLSNKVFRDDCTYEEFIHMIETPIDYELVRRKQTDMGNLSIKTLLKSLEE